jgi:hypothetical protein
MTELRALGSPGDQIMAIQQPNFFIIGAPKCGTSSLAHYLSEHPNVVFSSPKEPNYWATDFVKLRKFYNVETLEKYLSLFESTKNALAVGEGSTNYLRSETAVENILQFNPNASFIVMLRNPVEVVYALHNTLLYAMNEDVKDFETAWALQEERRRGNHVPDTCLAWQYLQYREMADFSGQLKRFMALVPEQQRMIIFFDDFVRDVPSVYRDVVSFLGLPMDSRTDFPVVNDSKKPRLQLLHRLIRRPPKWLARPIDGFRNYLCTCRGGIVQVIRNSLKVSSRRNALRPEFRRQLESEFQKTVSELEEIFGRDLSHWSTKSSTVSATVRS